MNRIFKYELEVTDTQEIPMPTGARILCVQNQHERLMMWAIVDDSLPAMYFKPQMFRVVGTGHIFDGDEFCTYIGTVQMHDGLFVWHVFHMHP